MSISLIARLSAYCLKALAIRLDCGRYLVQLLLHMRALEHFTLNSSLFDQGRPLAFRTQRVPVFLTVLVILEPPCLVAPVDCGHVPNLLLENETLFRPCFRKI